MVFVNEFKITFSALYVYNVPSIFCSRIVKKRTISERITKLWQILLCNILELWSYAQFLWQVLLTIRTVHLIARACRPNEISRKGTKESFTFTRFLLIALTIAQEEREKERAKHNIFYFPWNCCSGTTFPGSSGLRWLWVFQVNDFEIHFAQQAF